MKIGIALIFAVGASLAGLAPAQAMSVGPLAQQAGAESMVVQVKKACKRGYQLTPHGCRKMSGR
jgi:hypothetical protein